MAAYKVNKSRTPAAIGIAILFCLASYLFFWNLGSSSISARSDEVIYVRIAQSIIHSRDVFPLMHGNVPTYEKPPLKLWLSALALLLFGENNWGFRIIDGLFGLLVVGLTFLLARAMLGRVALSLLAAALLLAMPELVIAQHSFRHAVLDGFLCLLTVIGAMRSWKLIGAERTSWQHTVAIGTIWGLAVLTKSVAGFVPAMCSVASILLGRVRSRADISLHSLRSLVWILAIPLVTFITYAVILWIVAGSKAISVFLGIEILDRAFGGFSGHNTDSSWFYVWYLFGRGGATPRVLLLTGILGALVVFFKRPESRFLLVWSLLPVLLYSCAASRAPWYLSPYFPLMSILSIFGVASLCEAITKRCSRFISVAFLTVVIIVSTPPYYRALLRNVREVSSDTERAPIDLLVDKLRASYSRFVIVEDSISGRSNPRKGRFNLEGIYREALRPNLRSVSSLQELSFVENEVLLVRESSLPMLRPGWRELGRLKPSGFRTWEVVALTY